MDKMNRKQMINFLRDMEKRKETLKAEKVRIRSSVESMEEAIHRNTFSHMDNVGSFTPGYNPDKVLHILLNSERDTEEETRSMVGQMQVIYEMEDEISYVQQCILCLPGIDRELITEVFIGNGNVKEMAGGYGYCPSYFYSKLNASVDRLVAMYNKDCEHENGERAERFKNEVRPYMSRQEDPS